VLTAIKQSSKCIYCFDFHLILQENFHFDVSGGEIQATSVPGFNAKLSPHMADLTAERILNFLK